MTHSDMTHVTDRPAKQRFQVIFSSLVEITYCGHGATNAKPWAIRCCNSGKTWKRFATEAEAKDALTSIPRDLPISWIGPTIEGGF